MDIALDFIRKVAEAFAKIPTADGFVNIIVAIIMAGSAYLLSWLARVLGPFAVHLFHAIRNLEQAISAVSRNGDGVWLMNSERLKRAEYEKYFDSNWKIPIIVVANLKGGVGKTTCAANLIAHYAIKKGERVLGIDFDYQGSLTSMALTDEQKVAEFESEEGGELCKAAQLLEGKSVEWLKYASQPIKGAERARVITAFYSLAGVETKLMVEWLIGARKKDIRFELSSLLHDPDLCKSFDRVIIDAPPRLTTACISSLSAATHVIIPTVLDDLSAAAVGTFGTQLYIHQKLWPRLTLLGPLGTMTVHSGVDANGSPDRAQLVDTELRALVSVVDAQTAALTDAMASLRESSPFPVECIIPDRRELSRVAGHQILYVKTGATGAIGELKAAFDRLGDEIDRRIPWLRRTQN